MPSTGSPANTAARGSGTCHPGVDSGREPFALNDVALRGTHQRGDRQAVDLRQPPEQRQPLPVRRQTRCLGETAKPGCHIGPEPRSRGDGAQARRDRPFDLARGDVERGHRVRTDPQLADQYIQRALQRRRFDGASAASDRAVACRNNRAAYENRRGQRGRAGQHHRHRGADGDRNNKDRKSATGAVCGYRPAPRW